MVQLRKAPNVTYLGAAATRLIYAMLDPRRRRHVRLLFQRPSLGAVRGHGWIPKLWYSRLGRVFAASRGHTFRIYRGRKWRRLLVQRWNVGFAWGSYARSTTLAVFKKKASAKKRRRRAVQAGGPTLGLKIQQIRDVKAGLRRRGASHYDPTVEAQLRGVF